MEGLEEIRIENEPRHSGQCYWLIRTKRITR